MTLFTIEAEVLEFDCWSFGLEVGTWYVLISFGKRSLDLTMKWKPEYKMFTPKGR